MIIKKVSNRKFVSLLKRSSSEDFKYPEKYNIKTPLVQKCKYCKKKTVSGDLDIDNGIAVYVCKRCGGRNICPPRKIKFPRRILLLFLFLIFLSFIVVFGSDILAEIKIINEKINDFKERISDSVDDLFDGANDGTLYEGYNTISLNPNEEGVYLFKPTESGYYLFTSESSGGVDLDG